MGSGGWEQHLTRPRLLSALSAPGRVVVLVGPIGAGATTLLRHWAAEQSSVAWGAAGNIPERTDGVIVVDDADELSADDWRDIRGLLSANPGLVMRAAVRSRQVVPPAVEAEFVNELQFSADETREYLSMLGSNLDAAGVHRVTGGLPAAVRAVSRVKSLRVEHVDAALRSLDARPLSAQDARLAIPEVLTQEVVSALGGSSTFIADAERAGLGEWTADPGHPLFALTAPVRAATRAMHGTTELRSVRERAARTLLAQEAWYGALIEGAASGSLAVVDVALKGGGLTLLRARGASISTSLRDIRILELRHWPVIAMAQSLIFNSRREHRLRAVEYLGIALLGARSAPAGGADRALLRVIESVARRLLGLADGGVKAARSAARILGELPPDELRTIAGLVEDLHSHAAISLMYGGQDEEALSEFERALAVARRPSSQLVAYGGTAMIHALSGDLVTAQIWVDSALTRPWSTSLLDEYQGSMLRIAQAKIAIERDDVDGAEANLASIWHIIETVEHWPTMAYLRALIDIRRGRAGVGLEEFRALRKRRGRRKPRQQKRLLDLTESSLALAAGDMSSARRLEPQDGDSAAITLGAARIELFDGQYERAQRLLAGVSPDTAEARASLAVLEASVLVRLERHDAADAAARRARTISDAHGLSTPFLLVPDDDRALFGLEPGDSSSPRLSVKPAAPRLTERERVILAELVQTASVSDIAARLHVSENTVKSQRRSLYRKLGASSREEAIASAMGMGLIEPGGTGRR